MTADESADVCNAHKIARTSSHRDIEEQYAIEESAATRAPLRYAAIRTEIILSYLQALRATMQ